MVSLEEIEDLIKEIYIVVSNLSEKFTQKELKSYPKFTELMRELLNDSIQWKYFFLLEDPDLLFSLNESLSDLDEYNDENSFIEVERFSNDLINQIKSMKNNRKMLIDKEILDKEIVLKHALKFVNNAANADQKLSKLKNNIDHLHLQFEDIKDANNNVLESYEEAKKIINDLKNKNSVYNQIIDQDSNSRIRQHYDQIYADEVKVANKYRNWALIVFTIIGVLIAIIILVTLVQNTFSFFWSDQYSRIAIGWESLIKTAMLFSLTTPAWYLARESSKHRKVAYKAKMLGTELASFPLYAREFKDEDRLELRKQLADRFFGQELYSDSKTVQNSDSSLEQVKLLTEANKVLVESLKIKKVTE